MNPKHFTVLAMAAAHLLCPSCKRTAESTSRPDSVILASVGEENITIEDFREELTRRSPGGAGTASTSLDLSALLEEMVLRKATLMKARSDGFDKDPATVAMVERLIAERYQAARFSAISDTLLSVEDAEISEFYQSNESRFRTPEAVRAGFILIKASARASNEIRSAIRARATSILAASKQADDRQFKALVQQHSDDQATRYTGGDTGWMQGSAELSGRLAGISAAARKLKSPGDVAPLIESADGFLILRLKERQAAGHQPLAEAREAIRYQLLQRKRQDREAAFFDKLKEGLAIKINRPLLKSINPPDSPVVASSPPPLPGN